MDKYTVKATAQLAGYALAVATVGFITAAVLDYFKPTPEQGIFAIAMAVLAYTAYNLVKIQADILRFRDKNRK